MKEQAKRTKIVIDCPCNHDFDDYINQLQEENQQLKMINKEYERLNKENGRGFKITNVQEYNIHELLSYKNNWDELKGWLENLINESGLEGIIQASIFNHVLEKTQELERGVSNE